MMEKTLKINKLQGLLLVVAGIVLLSAMCFAVIFANFALTDKVANAEEATASADAVPFVVGTTYMDIYFDFNADNSSIEDELSTYLVDEPFEFLNFDYAVAIMGIANYNGNAYSLAFSSNFFEGFIWTSNDGWLIDSNFTFDNLYICSVSVPLSFVSSEPFESEPDPPVTYDDNLSGISVGDSALCIIPDLEFVGNEFYQDDSRTDFPIAEFSVSGVYNAYISVVGAGFSYQYSFCIYINSLNPTYRVDLYWAGLQDFGYYINKNLSLNLTYVGLTDEFYEMSAEAQQECYRFLNSLNFTSDAETVELYQDLLTRYDSLNNDYNNLVNSMSWYNLIYDLNNSIVPTSFDNYRSTDWYSGLFLSQYNVYFTRYSGTLSRVGDICVIPLGLTVGANTPFRLSYKIFGMVNSNTVGVNGGLHLGYINNGTLVPVYTSDDSNCWNLDGFNSFEFSIPVDIDSLYLYCENTSAKSGIIVADMRIELFQFDNQILVDSAYQRGVDSVNTNAYIQQGYEAGYYAGISEDNPYTFRSLMGAVVDAPLDVFTQMFDFDIMGVNMKTLYLSLFTLGIVLIVLKFALGRL